MKLTDTQAAVLTAAAARTDGAILLLPSHRRGGAIAKVCEALRAKGLAVSDADGEERLVISNAGRQALGLPIQRPATAKPPGSKAKGASRAPGPSRRSLLQC